MLFGFPQLIYPLVLVHCLIFSICSMVLFYLLHWSTGVGPVAHCFISSRGPLAHCFILSNGGDKAMDQHQRTNGKIKQWINGVDKAMDQHQWTNGKIKQWCTGVGPLIHCFIFSNWCTGVGPLVHCFIFSIDLLVLLYVLS